MLLLQEPYERRIKSPGLGGSVVYFNDSCKVASIFIGK